VKIKQGKIKTNFRLELRIKKFLRFAKQKAS